MKSIAVSPEFHPYSASGVLHVHSTRSDGRGEPEEIVQAGIEAGLDFIAFNDHRNLKLMEEGWHGRKTGNLISITGSELQHTDLKNHLLVYGVEHVKPGGHILDQLAGVKQDGGIAIIAHPCEKRPLIPGLGEFPWSFGTDCAVDGIEGWNWMSSWKCRVDPVNVWNRIKYPDDMVRHPNRDAVDMWFETGGALAGGADAHGHRIMGRDVFAYSMLFRRLKTHLLLNEPFSAPEHFCEALRTGSCFMSNAIAGDASEYRSAVIGENLYLKLPGRGRVSYREKGCAMSPPVLFEEGVHCIGKVRLPVYIEVYRNGRTWIAQGIQSEEK